MPRHALFANDETNRTNCRTLATNVLDVGTGNGGGTHREVQGLQVLHFLGDIDARWLGRIGSIDVKHVALGSEIQDQGAEIGIVGQDAMQCRQGDAFVGIQSMDMSREFGGDVDLQIGQSRQLEQVHTTDNAIRDGQVQHTELVHAGQGLKQGRLARPKGRRAACALLHGYALASEIDKGRSAINTQFLERRRMLVQNFGPRR